MKVGKLSPLLLLWGMFTAHHVFAQQKLQALRQDAASVPMVVFEPEATAGCPALALISHGAGGSEDGLHYLARGLQREGWRVIVIGHRESGPAALRGDQRGVGLQARLRTLITDPQAYQFRFLDIEAALRWAEAPCKPAFKALLGHSMGAATVMLEAGAANKLALQGQQRFAAYVALSPQGPGSIFPVDAWQGLRSPVLSITGTRDTALEGNWRPRTLPHAGMPPGCKWLAVTEGATHMNLGGVGGSHTTENLTAGLTATFLEALRAGRCADLPASPGVQLDRK